MYGFIITTAGEGLLARASAGEGLTLTEVWVGKGAVESAGAAKALTALLDPVAKATSTCLLYTSWWKSQRPPPWSLRRGRTSRACG